MYRSNTYKVLRYSTSALIGFILWQLIHSGIDTHQTKNRYQAALSHYPNLRELINISIILMASRRGNGGQRPTRW